MACSVVTETAVPNRQTGTATFVLRKYDEVVSWATLPPENVPTVRYGLCVGTVIADRNSDGADMQMDVDADVDRECTMLQWQADARR